MRSLRTFAYAAVLSLSIFAVQPTPAAAEDAHGTFKLDHEVHWQQAVLLPGEYSFSARSVGSAEFLQVRGLDRPHNNAMLLVRDVETLQPDLGSRLVLVSRDGNSYVSAMDLPELGMSFRFPVPVEVAPKPVETALK